ncbi:MAG: hypothetical protein H6628_03925 [Calditrichae bacterium]|nr:hypothetical protein [Calditrichia bacterium]
MPYNDMLLVDGAIVSIVPAEVVREMGVDIVVAVDVDQEGRKWRSPTAWRRSCARWHSVPTTTNSIIWKAPIW